MSTKKTTTPKTAKAPKAQKEPKAKAAPAVETPEQVPEQPVASAEAPAAKKEKKQREDGKLSGLDAAAQILKEAGEPMRCKDIVEKMLAKGLWTTNGKTPASTLYSAMLREIDTKPGASRFAKTGRGLFTLTAKA